MNEPIWLTVEDVIALHGEQLALFGGPPGLRDQGMLESALSRPINQWNYGKNDLAELAAAYAIGISRNHPFVDGNKRAAWTALIVFLRVNDVAFSPSSTETVSVMLELASGEMDEPALSQWIRDVIDGRRPRLEK